MLNLITYITKKDRSMLIRVEETAIQYRTKKDYKAHQQVNAL